MAALHLSRSLRIVFLFVLTCFVFVLVDTSEDANALDSGTDSDDDLPSVVVIGAGVAGLTAAATLHNTGKFNVTVLEAMTRIGGRTHTVRFPNGRHIEMGAEWIHGEEGNPMYELLEPLGVLRTYADPPLRLDNFWLPTTGTYLNDSMGVRLWELFGRMEDDTDGWGKDSRSGSYGQYAAKILDTFQEKEGLHQDKGFRNAVLDWLHRTQAALDAADNWYEVSARVDGDQYTSAEGFDNVTWSPPFGYSSLHQLILTGNVTEDGRFDLPPWIKLGKEVTTVNYADADADGPIQVCTRDGTCFSDVDHVIVTPSLGVLKAKHDTLFSPPLSVKRQKTIRSLGFGTATKYYLEFKEAWWPTDYNGVFPLWEDIEYDFRNPRWMYWRSNITLQELMTDLNGYPLWVRSVCRIFTVDSRSHPNMLRIWITGPTSKYLDYMDPSYVRLHVMRLIRRVIGPHIPGLLVVPEPIAVYQSKWRSDPFVRGVYSYRTLVADKADVWARDLAEPILGSADGVPRVLFAGEATHPKFYATVHGAYETGLREAERLKSWYSSSAAGGKSTTQGSIISPGALVVVLLISALQHNLCSIN